MVAFTHEASAYAANLHQFDEKFVTKESQSLLFGFNEHELLRRELETLMEATLEDKWWAVAGLDIIMGLPIPIARVEPPDLSCAQWILSDETLSSVEHAQHRFVRD